MSARDRLDEYVKGLIHHGAGESWINNLTLEQIAALSALSSQALTEALMKDARND